MTKKEAQLEPVQPEIRLQSFSYGENKQLLRELGAAIANAGGWVLERRPASSNVMTVRVEVPVDALPSVYGALLASGLHLTRDSHRVLAERCNCDLHRRPRQGVTTYLLVVLELHLLPGPASSQASSNGTLD